MAEQTDASANAANEAEAKGAQGESLDEILNEFDTGTAQTKPAETEEKPKATGGQQETEADRRLRQLEQESADRRAREAEAEARKAVDTCIGELGAKLEVKLPKRALEGYLETYARQNPKLIAAFVQRQANPKAWDRVLSALATDIETDFKSNESAETNNAIAAAVRSASTKSTAADSSPVTEAQIRGMSKTELYKTFPGLGRR